jgi:ABC-type multidrug transport system ATPase subunit
MATGHVLDVRGVAKSWPGAAAPVLSGVDLALAPGTLAVVEGANGAGKTTLLRVIAGLLEPDRGEVRVCDVGLDEDRVAYQRGLGVASAGNAGLYARLGARSHLGFGARLQLLPRERRRERVDQAIERFELAAFAGRRVDRLSMGQRQRLRLAMAFLHEPPVVLLDEPATSLDASGQAVLERALSTHLGAGRAAVWFAPTGGAPPALAHTTLRLLDGALA